ncbi:unnamed protein product [Lactuca virosa]|uniref:Uncharacterized protein n=1 Tax=Lactuca virosa TaxID=75947 RepID=A0AAU9P4N2_9ASTR|nr:unnamed protein product [Lactuca virosa]
MAKFYVLNTVTFTSINAKDFHYKAPIPEVMLSVVLANNKVILIYRKNPTQVVLSMTPNELAALEAASVGPKRTDKDDEVTIPNNRVDNDIGLEDTCFSTDMNAQVSQPPINTPPVFHDATTTTTTPISKVPVTSSTLRTPVETVVPDVNTEDHLFDDNEEFFVQDHLHFKYLLKLSWLLLFLMMRVI